MREQQKKANEETLKDEEAKYGKSHQRTQEYLKKQMALTKEGSDEYRSLQRRLWEDERQEKEENDRKQKSSAKKSGKDLAKSNLDIEKEIAKVRIDAMKEGLNKTITQLEEERKERLAKIRENGRDYKEAEAEINALYDKKIEDEIQNHTKEVEKMYDDMYKNIRQMEIDNANKELEIAKNSTKTLEKSLETTKRRQAESLLGKSSYGINSSFSQELEEMKKSNKEYIELNKEKELIYANINKLAYAKINAEIRIADEEKRVKAEISELEKLNLKNDSDIAIERGKLEEFELGLIKDTTKEKIEAKLQEYIESKRINDSLIEDKRKYLENFKKDNQEELSELKTNIDSLYSLLEGKISEINKYRGFLEKTYGEKGEEFVEAVDTGYGLDDTSLFKERMTNLERYWQERIAVTIVGARGEKEAELKLLKQTYSAEIKAADDNYNQQLKGLDDWQDKKRYLIIAQAKQEGWTKEETNRELLVVDKKYQADATKLYENYSKELANLEIIQGQREYEITEKYKEQQKKVTSEYYQSVLQEFRDFSSALNDKENRADVTGFLGIMNVSATRKNYKEILDNYNQLAQELKIKQEELKKSFKNGIIDQRQLDSALREIDRKLNEVGNKIEEIKEKWR